MGKVLGTLIGGLMVVAIVLFGLAALVMVAWNCLAGAMTFMPELGYWQAFSLCFIVHVLFKPVVNVSTKS